MKRLSAWVAAIALVVSVGLLGGCTNPLQGSSSGSSSNATSLTPKTSATISSGVLRVGVDYSSAPFAGTNSNGDVVGLDVDVAAAIAEQLGCTVEFVDVPDNAADSALQNKTVDIVMNIAARDYAATSVTTVGPYLTDGPALFTRSSSSAASSTSASTTSKTVGATLPAGAKVSAQGSSVAANQVSTANTGISLTTTSTLSEAFDSLEQGTVDYTAADALVGSYIALGYSDIVLSRSLSSTAGIYIGISAKNTQLASDVNGALAAIRGNGVLKVTITKWAGSDLSSLPDPVDTATYRTNASQTTSTASTAPAATTTSAAGTAAAATAASAASTATR